VNTRVSKYDYGITQDIQFNEKDTEHLLRSSSRFCDASGEVCLHNSFSIILPKVILSYLATHSHNYYDVVGHSGVGDKGISENILGGSRNT
jgi:hypothetical protein